MRWISLCLLILLYSVSPVLVLAGEVEVVQTVFTKRGDAWHVSTTLRHGDTGWDHYADAWRVVDEAGTVLGTRELLHPHEQEQPFTRSLSGVAIPAKTRVVYVEGRDKVHGWSQQRIRVDLTQPKGERFEVKQ